MKKIIALLLTLLMCFALCACGDAATDGNSTVVESDTATDADSDSNNDSVVAEPVAVDIGGSIVTDFMEMSIDEVGVSADIRTTVKADIVTRICGPEPEDGMQFIFIRGTIKNTSKEALPVYDFFIGQFDVDGYIYDASANECSIIDGNGSSLSEIAPLTEGSYTIYAKVPNELADKLNSTVFTFGFYDNFDNEEMSYNQAFEEDPIYLCPYIYVVNLGA